jgi:hypothetical protein
MTFSLKSWLFGPRVAESEREERLFLENSKVVLVERHSNPDRVGCPGSEFLARLARREVKMDELNGWTDHLSSCGECFREFESLKDSPLQAGVKGGMRGFMRTVKR